MRRLDSLIFGVTKIGEGQFLIQIRGESIAKNTPLYFSMYSWQSTHITAKQALENCDEKGMSLKKLKQLVDNIIFISYIVVS